MERVALPHSLSLTGATDILSLLLPRPRPGLHELRQSYTPGQPPVEAHLDDVGRQQRELEQLANIACCHLFGLGDFLDGGVLAGVEQILPAMGAGQGLDQSRVGLGRWRRPGWLGGAGRRDDQLAAATLAEVQGNVDRQDAAVGTWR